MRPRQQAGFTFIELVVVIAILGVMFAAAMPAFTTRRRDDATDPTTAITQLLERARNTAASTGHTTRITIAPAAARAWLRLDASPAAPDSVITLALPVGTTLSATTPRVEFTFEPSGRARGESLRIDANGTRIVLTIDPLSGDVRRSSNATP